MQRLSEDKIILVTRPTRVAELKRRFNTRMQAKFYVNHLGQDFADYEAEERQYDEAVKSARQVLETLGRVHPIDRSFLPNFSFGPRDLVIVLGQDGLVANTVKYLNGQPVIGVNPDPARWDGILLPFAVKDLARLVPEVWQQKRATKSVTMACARLNTGESLYAVNDLFIGPRSHTSARYQITSGDARETQSSSGVIVSTGVGSTGWFRSLMAGARGLATGPNGLEKGATPGARRTSQYGEFPWDADYLCFTVREPFPSRTTQAALVHGRITAHTPLILESLMPEHGVLFSDGIESDFLEFKSGTRATVTIADRRGCLVV